MLFRREGGCWVTIAIGVELVAVAAVYWGLAIHSFHSAGQVDADAFRAHNLPVFWVGLALSVLVSLGWAGFAFGRNVERLVLLWPLVGPAVLMLAAVFRVGARV